MLQMKENICQQAVNNNEILLHQLSKYSHIFPFNTIKTNAFFFFFSKRQNNNSSLLKCCLFIYCWKISNAGHTKSKSFLNCSLNKYLIYIYHLFIKKYLYKYILNINISLSKHKF